MLLKLIKHEFKNNWAAFAGLYTGLLVVGTLLRFNTSEDFGNLLITMYVVFAFTTIIFSFVTIIMTYNRSMFKKEGYLTLTLPVSTSCLLMSKIIVGATWFILSVLAVILSSFITIPDASVVWGEFMEVSDFVGLSKTFSLTAMTGIFSVIELIFTLYLIVTIVHTSAIKKFRVFSGIAIYFAINYLTSLFRTTFISDNASILDTDPVIESYADIQYYINNINQFLSSTMWMSILISLCICTACFIGIRYLLMHKIELD